MVILSICHNPIPIQDLMRYIVYQKNIPNIFECNLKTNYQILIGSAEAYIE